MTSANQNLKALQQEVTAGNERLSEAVSKGCHELSVALTGVNNPPVSATPLTPVGGSTAAPKLSCFPFLFFHKVSPRRRIVLSQRCSLLGFRSSWLQRALWNLWDLSSDLRHTSHFRKRGTDGAYLARLELRTLAWSHWIHATSKLQHSQTSYTASVPKRLLHRVEQNIPKPQEQNMCLEKLVFHWFAFPRFRFKNVSWQNMQTKTHINCNLSVSMYRSMCTAEITVRQRKVHGMLNDFPYLGNFIIPTD